MVAIEIHSERLANSYPGQTLESRSIRYCVLQASLFADSPPSSVPKGEFSRVKGQLSIRQRFNETFGPEFFRRRIHLRVLADTPRTVATYT